MDVRKGRVIFWKKKPNKGPAMVKGVAGDSTVELYDMQRDRFFLVPASEFARFRGGIVFDDKLKLEDPEAWARNKALWNKARLRCGLDTL